jgi:hypothetical protein
MDVREDGGDRASFTAGQLSAPCSGIEVLEDDLIHPLIYGVALHQHLAKVDVTV